MMRHIKRWLEPPLFADDAVKTRRAGLLVSIWQTAMLILLFIILGGLIGGRTPWAVLGVDFTVLAVGLILYYWTHQGRVGLAGGGLLAVALVAITLGTAMLGTIRTPTTAIYILLIIMAGALFDLSGMLIMTALCSLAVATLIVAENAGLLPPPDYTVTITQWATYTALFIGVGSLNLHFLNTTCQALAQAEQEVAERKQMEEVLRKSEARFHRLAENAQDIIYRYCFHPTPGYEYVSPASTAFTGYTPEEHYADPDLGFKIVHPDDRHLLEAATREGNKFAIALTLRLVCKDGAIIWTEQHNVPIFDDDGNLIAVEGTSRNITERKQADEKLRESEERYRTISSLTSDYAYSFRLEPDGTFTREWTTEAFFKITGYLPTDSEFKNGIRSIVHPDDHPILEERDRRDLAGEEVKAITHRIVRKDGEIRWLYNFGKSVRDESTGKIVHFYGAVQDITERKQAEDALRENEQFLSNLLENSPVSIYVTDADRQLRLVNRRWENDTGKPRADALGCRLDQVFPAEIARKFDADNQKVIETGASLAFEEVVEPHHLFTVKFPLRDALGQVEAVGGISVDITARKHAEDELNRSREQLRALAHYLQTARENERATIAREIHDELGQSLTALKMDLAWLTKRLPPEANALHEKAQGMATMINESLQLMRRIASDLRPGLLDDLGLIAAMEWQASEFTKRSDVVCKLNLPQELTLDRDRTTAIFRIFQEALTNITRHAQAKQVEVWLEADEAEIKLTVKDDGVGITADQINDPKSLGLIGARERVVYFNGSVSVESHNGTIVTVRIPKNLSLNLQMRDNSMRRKPLDE